MKFKYHFLVVDTHTEGEPTRILFWNLRIPRFRSVVEAREYIRRNYDWVRTAILHEPRGHRDSFGAIVMPSFSGDADYSLIFMDTAGYLDMCGHATIGVTVALIELGYVEASEPTTTIRYETPAGIVEVRAHVENSEVKWVSVIDVPSFYVTSTCIRIDRPRKMDIEVDIAFGGNFYVLVDADKLGIRVSPENVKELIDIALHIRSRANEQIKVVHPEKPFINRIALTMISDKPTRPEAHAKSIVVFAEGSVDRSPCGTGTAAKVATLYSKGVIGLGDEFVHESIIGTIFRCRPIAETRVGPYKAIVPEITGRAWITQICHVVIREDDPLKHGFLIV